MAETAVDNRNDPNRVGRTTDVANDDNRPDANDLRDVTAATDRVDDKAIDTQAIQANGVNPTPDTFNVVDTNDARAKENPASFLADTTLTRTQMDERLRGMSTPDLTATVKGVDDKSLDFGKKVTPDGWSALRGEIDRRFTEASEKKDFNNPDLAELSRETVRQDRFGDKDAPWSEKSWRQLATAQTAYDRRTDDKAKETYKTLSEANRLEQHRVAGSTPVSEMTNRQLLDRIDRIPGNKVAGELLAATGVPGMLAQAMGEGKANEQLKELEKRMEDGRIPRFEPNTGTDSNVGTALGVVSTIAQFGNPKNWAKKGIDAVKGLFKKKGVRPDAGDAGDLARMTGEARELAAETGLRKSGMDVRRWNQEFGNTEIDLMMSTPQGRYGVLVGGEAKALRNGKIDEGAVRDSVEKYRRAQELLTDPDGPFRGDGAGAMMAFPKGTDQRVLDRFIQEIGAHRILLF